MNAYNVPYADLEQHIRWPAKFAALVKRVIPVFRHRAITESLKSEQYEARLKLTAQFFTHLEAAFAPTEFQLDTQGNQTASGGDWEHRTVAEIQNFNSHSTINFNTLRECSALYLGYPWLQHGAFDSMLLDALLYHQILEERDGIVEKYRLNKKNRSVVFDRQTTAGIGWLTLALLIILLGVTPVAVLLFFFLFNMKFLLLAGGAVYAVLLLGFFVSVPVLFKEKRAKIDKLRNSCKGLDNLLLAYRYCEAPVMHPKSVMKYLRKAQEDGVIVSSSLMAIAGTIADRSPNALLTG